LVRWARLHVAAQWPNLEDRKMRRIKFLFLGLGLVLGLLIGPVGATGTDGARDADRRGTVVRWDLVQIMEGVVLPGGTDISAASNGDTIALTGSGHAEPRRHRAFGGGTFVHENAAGTVLGQGVYYVTGFVSWERLRGGSVPFIDGVGPKRRGTSGILTLDVHFIGAGGTPQFDGVLTIFCHLPGTIRDVPEGFALNLPALGLNFDEQVSGVTLFHVIRPLGALP
jgi:hypothetical protein